MNKLQMVKEDLELTFTNLNNELHNDNIRESKTLTNVYINLLHQFLHDPHDLGNQYKNFLLNHKNSLELLYEYVNKKLQDYLISNEYKFANDITLILQRIIDSINMFDSRLAYLDKNHRRKMVHEK